MNQITEEYQEKLASTIEKLEAFRLKQLEKTKEVHIYYCIPVILTVLAIPMYWKVNPIMAFVVLAIAVTIGVQIATTVVSKPSENYIADFKKQFFTIVAKSAFPKVSYQVKKTIPFKLLLYSDLFKQEPSGSDGSDYFKGLTTTGQKFQFSEVKLYKESEVAFEGFFYEIELPTNFKSKVIVLPSKGKRSPKSVASLDQLSLKGLMAEGNLVAVTNVCPKFEKNFRVYSHSKEMAYHVLLPSVIEGIYEIHKAWKVKPALSFINNKIYVAIPNSKTTFIPNIHESLLDNPNFVLIIEQLTMYFEVVKQLSIEVPKASKNVPKMPNKVTSKDDFIELDLD